MSSAVPVGMPRSEVKSEIDGEFNGWNGDSVFQLTNGQVWQQATYACEYHYAYRPNVLIAPSNDGGWVMQVEGMSSTLPVRRVA